MSTRALGAVIAVLLVAAGVLALRSTGGERVADRLPDSPDTTEEAPSRDVDEVVESVKAFVSEARGLEFKQDVPVELLEDDGFEARLLEDAEENRAELEDDERIFRALHLIEGDVDLYDVLLRFLGDATLGFYDSETGALVLRGGTLSPYARTILAHELTHALDDQWFELHRPDLDDADDEAGLAFSALVEGNASRIENAYRKTMSAAEQAQALAEEQDLVSSIDLSGVPPAVPVLVTFPYSSGPRFVRALVDAGGERRVDEALREPPTTSEHILRPQAWLEGHQPVSVPTPAADGEVIEEGGYGQFALELTLALVLGSDAAERAAGGWGGDRYVAWSTGDESACVRATFAMDSARDLDELARALREWASETEARVQRSADTVTFTSCG